MPRTPTSHISPISPLCIADQRRSSVLPSESDMGRPSSPLVCGALALFLASASALESCVQVSDASFSSSCPCDAGSEFTFQIEGQTTVTANTVSCLRTYDTCFVCILSGRPIVLRQAFPLSVPRLNFLTLMKARVRPYCLLSLHT